MLVRESAIRLWRYVASGLLISGLLIGLASVEVLAAQQPVPISAEDRALLGLTEVTEAEPLSGADLAHVQDGRRRLGLRADKAYVRKLQADPQKFGAVRSEKMLFGNLLITTEEVPGLRIRSELEWQVAMTGVGAQVRDLLGDSNAGALLRGNRWVVRCAHCNVAAVQASIVGLALPSPAREAVEVREVAYSSAELREFHGEIDAYLRAEHITTVGSGGGGVVPRVQVYVGPTHVAELTKQLRQHFPADAFDVVAQPGAAAKPGNGWKKLGSPTPFYVARRDGRVLTIPFVGAAAVSDPKNPCQYDYRAITTERVKKISIAIRSVYRRVHREPAGCDFVGYGRTVTVRLKQPVGARELVDDASDDAVAVVDGRKLLTPTWLPTGWRETGQGGDTANATVTWSRRYGIPRSGESDPCRADGGGVWLGQTTARAAASRFVGPGIVEEGEVRGQPAEFWVDPRSGSTAIRWRESDQTVVLDGFAPCAGVPAPSLDVLRQIAEGLKPTR